jgi:hypothetical protein
MFATAAVRIRARSSKIVDGWALNRRAASAAVLSLLESVRMIPACC